jgi:hypothetical protein
MDKKKDHGDGCMHNIVIHKSLIQVHKKLFKWRSSNMVIYINFLKTSSNYVIMKLLDPKNKKQKLINLLGVLFKG